MTTTTTTATPAKLRDGTWGARVMGTVAAGDSVTITTQAGKSWGARIERVIWSGEGVSICATSSLGRGARIESSRQAWGGARGMGRGHGRAAHVAGYASYCTDNESCGCYDCAS